MTRPLIGLVGKKRAGKDTVAATLVDEFGFARYAFADPLKQVATDLDPVIWQSHEGSMRLASLVSLRGWEKAKEIAEVRRILQVLGTSMRERVDAQIWLNATMDRVREETRPVVVTDVRFPNEADAIEAAGGFLVRVHRPALEANDPHISENALNERLCHLHIDNGASLTELIAAARALGEVALRDAT